MSSLSRCLTRGKHADASVLLKRFDHPDVSESVSASSRRSIELADTALTNSMGLSALRPSTEGSKAYRPPPPPLPPIQLLSRAPTPQRG